MCSLGNPMHSCRSSSPLSTAASGMMTSNQRIDHHGEPVIISGRSGTTTISSVVSETEERERVGAGCRGRKSDYTRIQLRPHSTPATLLWLEANYEMADGVCIPRSTLYTHYVHFCGENGLQPVNAASFGKIIRQQFPLLTTRRLGTRGQSRYHYYGIAIRENSVYYDVTYSRKGVNCNSEGRREVVRQNGLSQPRYKLSPLLPEFPNLRDVCLPAGIPEASFLMMYRTHCHRIFDTIMRASLEEVQNFLLHFWQGMPPHLLGILGSNVVVNMVGVCDSILYRTICNVLMPSVLQSVPDNLLHIIRKFALELEVWLHVALEDLPITLRNVKLSLAHNFTQMLKRQSSLNHLCQAAQMVIHNPDLTSQMLQDLRKVDLQAICRQTMYTMDKAGGALITELITSFYHEFEQLLEGQATIETYTEWLESIVERCVIQPVNRSRSGSSSCLRQVARQFLLVWTGFGTRVIRDMTLHSAPSFGMVWFLMSASTAKVISHTFRVGEKPSTGISLLLTEDTKGINGFTPLPEDGGLYLNMLQQHAQTIGSFHLLHLMFDDYVLHLVDILYSEDRAKEMLRNVNCDSPPELDTNWESTDTDEMLLGGPSSTSPNLHPDYAQLQHIADDAQDIPEMNHHGATSGEYDTHAESFPNTYQYDLECRNGYKTSGKTCTYQVYNQHNVQSQNTMEDDTVSSNTGDERPIKYLNSSAPSYSPSDCNSGICSQYVGARRCEPDEIATTPGLYYQNQNGTMHSISSNTYYHNYESNANYHYNSHQWY